MHFSTGLFPYTSPQGGVGRVQSHRAVFACVCAYVCACVYVVLRLIAIQTPHFIMVLVFFRAGKILLTELELLHLCAYV